MYKLLENFKSFKVFLLKETIHSYYLSIKSILFTITFKRNYYGEKLCKYTYSSFHKLNPFISTS